MSLHWILRACASGLIGYGTPRILKNIGVPLDEWLMTLSGWLVGAQRAFDSESALWAISIILGLAIFGASYWLPSLRSLLRARESQERSETSTKRAFDVSAQQQFVKLLNERLPERGWVEIKNVAINLRPFAQRLEALFNSANWETNLNSEPISPHQVHSVEGVEISGFNEYYVDSVISVFRDTGVTDIDRKILENQIPRTHVKWPMTQKRVNVENGIPRE